VTYSGLWILGHNVWCGSWKIIVAMLEELTNEYAVKIACQEFNTNICPNIAT